jgi:hypothetical protein
VGAIVLLASAGATHCYTVTRLTKLTLLMSAAQAGDAAVVARELRAGADPNRVWNEGGFRIHGTPRTGVTPLLFALESGGPGHVFARVGGEGAARGRRGSLRH